MVAQRIVFLAAVALCSAAPALAGAAARQQVHASLAAVAPAKAATGTFAANGAPGRSVVVRWQLSISRLSGAARKATLQTPGKTKITFTLCQPCAATAHGQIALLGSVWRKIAAGGGTVVVMTKAHPRGELRGSIRRG